MVPSLVIRTPVLTHPPILQKEVISSKLNEYLPEKIDNFINSFPYFPNHLFSSQSFYKIVQVTLLTSSCIGVLGAIGLLALGMPSFSLMTLALSSTTAIGAYLASEAITNSALESSIESLQEETDKLQIVNKSLENSNGDLKVTINELKYESNQLKKHNETLRDSIEKLEKVLRENGELKPVLAEILCHSKGANEGVQYIRKHLENA